MDTITSQGILTNYRISLSDAADNLDADRALLSDIEALLAEIDTLVDLPGDLASGLEDVEDALSLPNGLVSALSPLPFGIGSAVRQADTVSTQVVDAIRPYREKLEKIDDKLTPVDEALDEILDFLADVADPLRDAQVTVSNMVTTATLLRGSMTDAPSRLGDTLEQRIADRQAVAEAFNAAHEPFEAVATEIGDLAGRVEAASAVFPVDIIDDALAQVQGAFGPISGALQDIEDTLCQTFTVVPGVPAVTVPNPFGGTITLVPAIPPLTVNACTALRTIDQQIGIVRSFLESQVDTVLGALGIDLNAALDGLTEKLLAPFSSLADAIADAESAVEDIQARIEDAFATLQTFFSDLQEMLVSQVPARLFDHQQNGGAGADLLEGFDAPELLDALGVLSNEDALFGAGGDDVLRGNGGDDFLFGGDGADTMEGGAGDDEKYGGEGVDSFVFAGAFGDDFVSDGSGGETLAFDAGAILSLSRSGEGDLRIEAGTNSVTVEGWFDGGRYTGAQVTVGGVAIALDGLAPEGPAPAPGPTPLPTPQPINPVAWLEQAILDHVPACLPPNPLAGLVGLPQPAVCTDHRPALEAAVDAIETALGALKPVAGDVPAVASIIAEVEAIIAPIESDLGGRLLAFVTGLVDDLAGQAALDPALAASVETLVLAVEGLAEGQDPAAALDMIVESLGDIATGGDDRAGLPGTAIDAAAALAAEISTLVEQPRQSLPALLEEAASLVEAIPGIPPFIPALILSAAGEIEAIPSDLLDDVIEFADQTALTLAGGALQAVDAILGSPGQDTLILETVQETVARSLGDDGVLSLFGPDGGVTRLFDVERIEFADATFIFDLGEQAATTYRLYAAALGREPDEAGLRFWDSVIENQRSFDEVANDFIASGEFQSLVGPNPTAEAYVDTFYENVLGREGEQAGRDFWVDVLRGPGMDAAEVLMAFVNSGENIENQLENYSDGFLVV